MNGVLHACVSLANCSTKDKLRVEPEKRMDGDCHRGAVLLETGNKFIMLAAFLRNLPGRWRLWLWLTLLPGYCGTNKIHGAQALSNSDTNSIIVAIEGRVEILPVGNENWAAAQTNQVLKVGDQVRTGFRSRAMLRLSDLTDLRMNQLTTLQIQAPKIANNKPVLDLKSGATYFLGRDKPTETEFRTPQTSGRILGTEFDLAVTDDGRTIVTLLDGRVQLTNDQGQLQLTSGEQGTVPQGR